MWSKLWYWYLPVLLAGVWCGESAAVEPADALGDHMVLQREKPVAVRYAWSWQPHTANLYNREGFAALPFASR